MNTQLVAQVRRFSVDVRECWQPIDSFAEAYLSVIDTTPDVKLEADTVLAQLLYFSGNVQGWRGPDARRLKRRLTALMNRVELERIGDALAP